MLARRDFRVLGRIPKHTDRARRLNKRGTSLYTIGSVPVYVGSVPVFMKLLCGFEAIHPRNVPGRYPGNYLIWIKDTRNVPVTYPSLPQYYLNTARKNF